LNAVRNIGKENQAKVKIHHLRTRDSTTGKSGI